MSKIAILASKYGRSVSALMRLAAHGEHPQRGAFIRAFISLQIKIALSSIIGRPVRSLSLCGVKVQFSDPRIFSFLLMEIFIEESYRGCHPPPSRIVDLGSNIGMSILWFKSLWPGSAILGIEASPQIFEILEKNVQSLAGVTVQNYAVSDHEGHIMFYSAPGSLMGSSNSLRGGSDGTMVEARPMSCFITGVVDLFKIDIEGSEMAAFAELEASGKLALIRQMFIEYHHRLPGESHSLASFLHRLEQHGFVYSLAAQRSPRHGDMQDILIHAWRQQE
jgi:FkbM family methyltransferase